MGITGPVQRGIEVQIAPVNSDAGHLENLVNKRDCTNQARGLIVDLDC